MKFNDTLKEAEELFKPTDRAAAIARKMEYLDKHPEGSVDLPFASFGGNIDVGVPMPNIWNTDKDSYDKYEFGINSASRGSIRHTIRGPTEQEINTIVDELYKLHPKLKTEHPLDYVQRFAKQVWGDRVRKNIIRDLIPAQAEFDEKIFEIIKKYQ